MITIGMLVHNVPSRSREILGMTETAIRSMLGTMGDVSPVEVILVDNGSRDAGEAERLNARLLEESGLSYFSSVRYDDNGHISTRWNQIIEVAQGDTIVFVNNDMVFVRQGWLSAIVDPLRHQNVGAVGSRQLNWNGFTFLEGSILAFRKAVALAIAENGKVFDERFEFSCEDVDFCHRLTRHQYRLVEVPVEGTGLVSHLHHGTLSWSNEEGGWNGKSILDVMHMSRIMLCRKYGLPDKVDD